MRPRFTVALLLALAGSLTFGAMSARAQNLIPNPGFDTGAVSWDLFNGGRLGTPAWQHVDADGSPASGSLRVHTPAGAPAGGTIAGHCVDGVAPSTLYALSAQVRSSLATFEPVLRWFAYDEAGCAGTTLDSGIIYGTTVAGSWTGIGNSITTPVGTVSLGLDILSSTSTGGGAQTLEFDDLFLWNAAASPCEPMGFQLCLNRSGADHRFAAVATYSSPPRSLSGVGGAISLQSLGVGKGGVIWFFAEENPELLVKVLDGCGLTGHFWVYISAGTDVGVDLRIADTTTGVWYLFHSPDGTAFPNIQDVYAMPCS